MCLSVHLSVSHLVSVCVCVCVCVRVCVCFCICLYAFVCMCICECVCVCLRACGRICLFVFLFSVNVVCLFVFLNNWLVCLFLSLSVCSSVYFSFVSLSVLSVCLSVSPFVSMFS